MPERIIKDCIEQSFIPSHCKSYEGAGMREFMLECLCCLSGYSFSSRYSRMSPGWQSNSLQIASSVEKRIAFAFPVFRIERLAGVRSIFSASSLSEIFRFAIITSKFTIIGIVQVLIIRCLFFLASSTTKYSVCSVCNRHTYRSISIRY